MTRNHGEYSIDVTFENLKRSVEIYWGCTYLCWKSHEGTSGNWISFQ